MCTRKLLLLVQKKKNTTEPKRKKRKETERKKIVTYVFQNSAILPSLIHLGIRRQMKIFEALLELQNTLLKYYLATIQYLYQELLTLFENKVSIDVEKPDLERISFYTSLIEKYQYQIIQLTDFNKGHTIYITLQQIINSGIQDVLGSITALRNLEQKLIRASSEALLIQPGIEEKLKWIIDENNHLHKFQNDQDEYQTFLARLKNEINNVPPPQYTCQTLNKFVEDIVHEYSLNIPILEIVIEKLNRNYNEEELFLEKLQNSILQLILEQEVDTSSVSFTEQEIKVIDIMEILTAHIDFFKRLSKIYIKFDKLLLQKLKLDNLPAPESVDLKTHVTKKLDNFIKNLVAGGTVGLSTEQTYLLVFSFIQNIAFQFQTFNENYIGYIPDNRPGRYGDDESFWTLVKEYIASLHRVTKFLEDPNGCGHDVNIIMGNAKEEFEQLESEAREYFFALLPFERIFECDEKIVNYQLGEKSV